MNEDKRKKGIIVAVDVGAHNFSENLEELELLCNTLEVSVERSFIQRKRYRDPNFYVGKGKIGEIKEYLKHHNIDVVIFNTTLSPIQRKNWRKSLKIDILDRNEIILEIFRIHARTSQSKLQVEIAKLQYELPNLIGKGKSMSRTGGGIGTLGPGETALEYDRRKIRRKLNFLKKKLVKIERSQQLILNNKNNGIAKISIAGYTSAGKSTLLKALTSDEKIKISKSLFSTLSTLSRKVTLPSGVNAVFSDTVGFIKDIPVQLVESFKSTLAHINYSDLIIVLIDASDENYLEKMISVEKILNDITSFDIPRLIVFNKIDRLVPEKVNLIKLSYPEAYLLSALSQKSVSQFLSFLESFLITNKILEKSDVFVPMKKRYLIDKLRGEIGVIPSNSPDSLTVIGKHSVISRLISLLSR
jgi:GTP-binding protein HflX